MRSVQQDTRLYSPTLSRWCRLTVGDAAVEVVVLVLLWSAVLLVVLDALVGSWSLVVEVTVGDVPCVLSVLAEEDEASNVEDIEDSDEVDEGG